MSDPSILIEDLHKTFTLHNQGSVTLPVLTNANLTVRPGDCVVLHGPSGVGKSSLLRVVYGNYKAQRGRIMVRHDGALLDVARAAPRDILAMRKRTMGYISQFLRAVPRVPAEDVVAEPLRALGMDLETARAQARSLLSRLNIPQRLWSLAPSTYSGGEQQRVNIARGFAYDYPVLLLDEPTASLDAKNRRAVIELIEEAKVRGTAMIGIFHDQEVREAVGTQTIDMSAFASAA